MSRLATMIFRHPFGIFQGAHAPSRAVFGALAEHTFQNSNRITSAAVTDRRYRRNVADK